MKKYYFLFFFVIIFVEKTLWGFNKERLPVRIIIRKRDNTDLYNYHARFNRKRAKSLLSPYMPSHEDPNSGIVDFFLYFLGESVVYIKKKDSPSDSLQFFPVESSQTFIIYVNNILEIERIHVEIKKHERSPTYVDPFYYNGDIRELELVHNPYASLSTPIFEDKFYNFKEYLKFTPSDDPINPPDLSKIHRHIEVGIAPLNIYVSLEERVIKINSKKVNIFLVPGTISYCPESKCYIISYEREDGEKIEKKFSTLKQNLLLPKLIERLLVLIFKTSYFLYYKNPKYENPVIEKFDPEKYKIIWNSKISDELFIKMEESVPRLNILHTLPLNTAIDHIKDQCVWGISQSI